MRFEFGDRVVNKAGIRGFALRRAWKFIQSSRTGRLLRVVAYWVQGEDDCLYLIPAFELNPMLEDGAIR